MYRDVYFRPYLFLIGMLLCLVFGIVGFESWNEGTAILKAQGIFVLALIILGIIAGLLDVPEEYAMPFSMMAAVFLLASGPGLNLSTLAYLLKGMNVVIKTVLGYSAIFTCSIAVPVILKHCLAKREPQD